MTRQLLAVVLVILGAVQFLHVECWLTCAEVRLEAHVPSCHEKTDQAWRWSDSHDCGDHTPQVALHSSRVAPTTDGAVLTTITLAPPKGPLAGLTSASAIVLAESDGPPGFHRPLRI